MNTHYIGLRSLQTAIRVAELMRKHDAATHAKSIPSALSADEKGRNIGSAWVRPEHRARLQMMAEEAKAARRLSEEEARALDPMQFAKGMAAGIDFKDLAQAERYVTRVQFALADVNAHTTWSMARAIGWPKAAAEDVGAAAVAYAYIGTIVPHFYGADGA